jgi:rod shape-determining protein MreD
MSEPWSQLDPQERAERLLSTARAAAPTLATMASLALMALPIWLSGPILPNLAVLGVFYWSTHRPEWMPPWAAFLIGLLLDVWLGQPLGLNAALLAVMAAILNSQALVFLSRPFGFAAAVFVPLMVVYQLLAWWLGTLVTAMPLPLTPMLVQTMTTILVLPLASLAHGWLNRRLTPPL